MKNRKLLSAIVVVGALFGTLTACSENSSPQENTTYAISQKAKKHETKKRKLRE